MERTHNCSFCFVVTQDLEQQHMKPITSCILVTFPLFNQSEFSQLHLIQKMSGFVLQFDNIDGYAR